MKEGTRTTCHPSTDRSPHAEAWQGPGPPGSAAPVHWPRGCGCHGNHTRLSVSPSLFPSGSAAQRGRSREWLEGKCPPPRPRCLSSAVMWSLSTRSLRRKRPVSHGGVHGGASPGLPVWPWFPRGLTSVSLRPLFTRCALGTGGPHRRPRGLCLFLLLFFCYFLWGFFWKTYSADVELSGLIFHFLFFLSFLPTCTVFFFFLGGVLTVRPLVTFSLWLAWC